MPAASQRCFKKTQGLGSRARKGSLWDTPPTWGAQYPFHKSSLNLCLFRALQEGCIAMATAGERCALWSNIMD